MQPLSLAATILQKLYWVTVETLLWMKKKQHDKALEAYQAASAKYQKDRKELLDWVAAQDRLKNKAISKIPTEH